MNASVILHYQYQYLSAESSSYTVTAWKPANFTNSDNIIFTACVHDLLQKDMTSGICKLNFSCLLKVLILSKFEYMHPWNRQLHKSKTSVHDNTVVVQTNILHLNTQNLCFHKFNSGTRLHLRQRQSYQTYTRCNFSSLEYEVWGHGTEYYLRTSSRTSRNMTNHWWMSH